MSLATAVFRQSGAVLMRFAVIATVLLFMLLQSGPCKAIEPLKVFRGALLIEGPIEAGDFGKLRAFLSDWNTFQKARRGVFLASPGGRVLEAIRMGYLLRALKLRTLLPAMSTGQNALIQPRDLKRPADYLCGSACFFLYVAGIDRNPRSVGRLGIHSPFVKSRFGLPIAQKDKDTATKSLEGVLSHYSVQMNIHEGLLKLMFSIPSRSVHWVTDAEFSKFVRWTSPELKAELQQKCADTNEAQVGEQIIMCREKAAADLAARGWKDTYNARVLAVPE